MKNIFLRIILILSFLILESIIGSQFQKRILTKQILNGFLTVKDYNNLIENNELKYDFKTGKYYMKIIFTDEPQHIYELYIIDGFSMFAYENNNEITDKNIAKYIFTEE